MDFNSQSDSSAPNQAYPGPNYTQLMDGPNAPGSPGNTTIHRKGKITRLDLTGNLTGSRVATFGTVAAEGWLPADVVYVSLPTHTGAESTFQITNIAGTVLATWPQLVANGGMFVFNMARTPNDFDACMPGNSST
jgi:hypothetical protein